jgi:hypothetical protein
MDLEKIATKMVNSKFTPMNPDKVFIGYSEQVQYGLSFKKYVTGYFVGFEEMTKYNIFRGFFNPVERTSDDEEYNVIIVTDEKKTKILCSLIYIQKDSLSDKHEVIVFNLKQKK